MKRDVFLCHASEDKDNFVRPLAVELKRLDVSVWYDEFSLVPGSPLRESIDSGLAECSLGIVVLSPSFFKKTWTQWELDGLVQRHLESNHGLLIPVWLDVSASAVRGESPPLANIVALQAGDGVETIATQIRDLLTDLACDGKLPVTDENEVSATAEGDSTRPTRTGCDAATRIIASHLRREIKGTVRATIFKREGAELVLHSSSEDRAAPVRLPLESSFAGLALRRATTLSVQDTGHAIDARLTPFKYEAPVGYAPRVQSIVVAPLRNAGGQVEAVLCIDCAKPNVMTKRIVREILMMAGLTGLIP